MMNISFLCAFTMLYLAPILLASPTYVAPLSIGAFLSIFGIGFVVMSLTAHSSNRMRKASKRQANFIALTSFTEFIAATIGLVIGLATDTWWPLGPLLVGTVALHFLSLTMVYHRIVDYYALTLTVMTLVLLVAAPISPLWNLWAVSGSIVAACTTLYIVELSHTLRACQKP